MNRSASCVLKVPHHRTIIPASIVKRTFKSWSKLKSSNVNDTSISRLTAILNIDIPKTLKDALLVRNTAANVKTSKAASKQNQPKVHAIHLRDDVLGARGMSSSSAPSVGNTTQEAEQHDLETTVTKMNSVMSDFLDCSIDEENKGGKSKKLDRPFSKPPHIVRKQMKEMQQPVLQQISNLLPRHSTGKQPTDNNNDPNQTTSLHVHSADQQITESLVEALRTAKTDESKFVQLKELCHHLHCNQDAKDLAVRVSVRCLALCVQ